MKDTLNTGRRLSEHSLNADPMKLNLMEEIPKPMELKGYGLHDDAPDLGCWAHSFCTYCTSDFCREDLQTYVTTEYSSTEEGASVTAFRDAVSNIETTCVYFGYDVYGDDDW